AGARGSAGPPPPAVPARPQGRRRDPAVVAARGLPRAAHPGQAGPVRGGVRLAARAQAVGEAGPAAGPRPRPPRRTPGPRGGPAAAARDGRGGGPPAAGGVPAGAYRRTLRDSRAGPPRGVPRGVRRHPGQGLGPTAARARRTAPPGARGPAAPASHEAPPGARPPRRRDGIAPAVHDTVPGPHSGPGLTRMELLLVRHAIAAERDPSRWPDDRDRPLTSQGEERMRRAARGLGRIAPEVDLAFASPLVRAWRTAEILHEEIGWPAPEASSQLL